MGAPLLFPPKLVVAVKALACELPTTRGAPLARGSVRELRREVIEQGLVAEIGGTTIWRGLSEDALRPWRYRSWLFPRDPDLETKAGRVLDLYAGIWQNQALSQPPSLAEKEPAAGHPSPKRLTNITICDGPGP